MEIGRLVVYYYFVYDCGVLFGNYGMDFWIFVWSCDWKFWIIG